MEVRSLWLTDHSQEEVCGGLKVGVRMAGTAVDSCHTLF